MSSILAGSVLFFRFLLRKNHLPRQREVWVRAIFQVPDKSEFRCMENGLAVKATASPRVLFGCVVIEIALDVHNRRALIAGAGG